MCVRELKREREREKEVEVVRVQRSPPAVEMVAVPLITFLLLHVFLILKSFNAILKTHKFKTIYNNSSYTTTKY